jgi:hypothetical protein
MIIKSGNQNLLEKNQTEKKFTQKLCKIRKDQSIQVNVAVYVMIPATVHKQK